jgi:hypothetical protein
MRRPPFCRTASFRSTQRRSRVTQVVSVGDEPSRHRLRRLSLGHEPHPARHRPRHTPKRRRSHADPGRPSTGKAVVVGGGSHRAG